MLIFWSPRTAIKHECLLAGSVYWSTQVTGIDLDVFLARQPKDRMVRKLGQQLRINRSKIKETSDTNTDFDDLDGAIRSGYFLKDGLSNNEDFYYLNLLITVTAGSVDDLEWKVAEMKKLLLSQDMDVQTCSFCQEQAFFVLSPSGFSGAPAL